MNRTVAGFDNLKRTSLKHKESRDRERTKDLPDVKIRLRERRGRVVNTPASCLGGI